MVIGQSYLLTCVSETDRGRTAFSPVSVIGEDGVRKSLSSTTNTVLAMSKHFKKDRNCIQPKFGAFSGIWVVCNSSLFKKRFDIASSLVGRG